jgi:hypothetical protein
MFLYLVDRVCNRLGGTFPPSTNRLKKSIIWIQNFRFHCGRARGTVPA